ncbi:MAG TPA: tripartite tricarboxylate transporter substrate binding protein [Burkholderiales bacterium]|nr:tripartite tricarboxylate transporter substrate binding protein [Burkholderiales bacterium]
MKMNCSGWIAVVVALAGTVPAHAQQQYPSRPVRVILPFAAGSTSDSVMRYIQPQLAAELGQPVVIDNRPGAGGNLGAEVAAKSTPDGYTVLMGNVAQSVSMSLYSKLGYDLVRDFEPVTLLAAGSYIMVAHPSLPVKSVKEFIALAKKRPGDINVGTAGATIRLAAKLFESMAGTKMTEVQYKSSPQLITALVSGEAHIGFPPTSVALPQVKSGRLRALAVTGAKRSAIAPDIPAVAETVPGYDVTAWYGLLAPTGTPNEVITRLHAAAHTALASPEVKQRFSTTDLEPSGSTPEHFGALMRSDVKKWAKVIKESGMRVD